MPGPKIVLAFCLISFVSSGSHGQQPVAPPPKPADDARVAQPVASPPKPADDGPSLDVTMKFIQDKMNERGTVRYRLKVNRSWAKHDAEETEKLVNVAADPQRCTIKYQRVLSRLNNQRVEITPIDVVLDLKEVEEVTVQSLEKEFYDQSRNEPTLIFIPPIFRVAVRRNHELGGYFLLDDEELANRLARAITHAVELCTPDKKPEPF